VAQVAGVRRDEGVRPDPRHAPRRQPPVADRQAALAQGAEARHVLDGRRPAHLHAGFRLEALHRAGELEVVARPAFGRQRRLPVQRPPDVDHVVAHAHGVGDRPPAVGGGDVQPVGHRGAPVRPGLDPGQAVLDAQQAADVAGVAVRVPAGRVADHQGLLKVVVAVEQAEHDQAVVGHHVAYALVVLVAVVGLQPFPRPHPVIFPGPQFAQVGDHAVDRGVGGDQAGGRVQQPVEVCLHEGLGLHGGDHLRAVDGLAVMADAARPPGQVGGQLRVARRDHRPAVDEDLGADLLGDGKPVGGDRAAGRRFEATLEPLVSGMLG